MSRTDHEIREELRDRFLEISLDEILAEDEAGRPLNLELRRRRARWVIPFAAAMLLVVVLPLLRREAAENTGPGLSETCEGIVRLPDGKPAAGATVRLELGWRAKDLPEGMGPLGVETLRTKADDAGRFRFADLPSGYAGTVFAALKKRFGRARAASEMELTLLVAGKVVVRVVAPPDPRRRLQVSLHTPGWNPLEKGGSPWLASRDGRFESFPEPAGPATLVVSRGNWALRRISVDIVSGKTIELPAIELLADSPPLPGPNPIVDADKVRLLDAEGRPVKNAWFWFESWGTVSDENGEVVMKHTGGRNPPFRILISRIGGDGWPKTVSGPAYSGALEAVKDRVAIIRLTPLRTIEGVVRRGEKAVSKSRTVFRTRHKPPRHYYSPSTDGRYSIEVPPGRGTLLVLTADGKLHREDLEVKSGEGAMKRDIDLPD